MANELTTTVATTTDLAHANLARYAKDAQGAFAPNTVRALRSDTAVFTDGPQARTLWIKARVHPDELAGIERVAAEANRTLSEFMRTAVLAPLPSPTGLSAIDRPDLSRLTLAIKQHGPSPVLADLQALIRRIGELD